MVFFIRPTKGLSANITGPRKLPANRIYYTVGLVRMDESLIRAFQCSSRISEYMENCWIDIRDTFAFPHLDDVLVYLDDFDSHVDHLRKVFQILKENGIKVRAKKCKLFQKQISFLGRTITDKGYVIDTANIKTVADPFTIVPSNIGQLRRIPGLLGYYRRYIKSFSRIAQPLFDLLKKDNIKSSSKVLNASTSIHWQWQHQQALKTLIAVITSPTLLPYPDFDQPFILLKMLQQKI